jgi:hypothetical protein
MNLASDLAKAFDQPLLTSSSIPLGAFMFLMVWVIACVLILNITLVAAIGVMLRWPHPGVGRFAIGLPLILLPLACWFSTDIERLLGVHLPSPESLLVVPLGSVVWLALFGVAVIYFRKAEREERAKRARITSTGG